MEKPRILIIEDNSDTRLFLETALTKEFQVISAENAVIGIDLARNQNPDLIVLDIMMPILNGYEACQILKKDENTKQIPIIFLSAKSNVSDITQGLGIGAEDYLSKPFDYKELIARIHVRLREKMKWNLEPKTMTHGHLKIVLDTREVFYNNSPIELTQTEFEILKLLLQNAGHAVKRSEIIQTIWKDSKDSAQKRTIDVHIRALRRKIPALTKHILSIYGKGYQYEK